MKKIFFSLVALAAIAACSKSEVEYDNPAEIGFAPVAKISAKSAVSDAIYPTTLSMYIFANAGNATDAIGGYSTPYFKNATFAHRSNGVFGGAPTAYYWPNVKKLIFSGYSASGNVASLLTPPTYEWNGDNNWEIKINGYEPGTGTATEGNNDLMWFPTTPAYGKADVPGTDDTAEKDDNIEVVMQHACAWVTINIKGDNVTGADGTTWKITDISFDNLSQSGNVTLGTVATWTSITTGDDFEVFANTNGKELTTEYVDYTKETIKDLVIVPQDTKTIYVTYKYISQADLDPIEEILPIELTYPSDEGWKAGKHYTYNITIGTKEILVEPTVKAWDTVATDAIVM